MVHPLLAARIAKIERERANKAVSAKYQVGVYNPKAAQESEQREPPDAPIIHMTPPAELAVDYAAMVDRINAMITKQNESLAKLKAALEKS